MNGNDSKSNQISDFRVVFPTEEYVKSSKLGENGAGTITFQKKYWLSDTFPKSVMYQSISNGLSHKVIVAQEKEGSRGFYYIGSHNCTESAWGSLGKAGQVRMNNHELGIVFELDSNFLIPFCDVKPYEKEDVPWTIK